MKNRIQPWTHIFLVTAFSAGIAFADDPAVSKDLTAVIALQGKPCGQVVSAVKKGDNDHVATCEDGRRYHVFLNADGRVMVQKL